MATGGGALWLCALALLVSAAHLHDPCSDIRDLERYCKDGNWNDGKQKVCGGFKFRCYDQKFGIQFRVPKKWFSAWAVQENPWMLDVEDSDQGPRFLGKQCDFMYKFYEPWPPFSVPLPRLEWQSNASSCGVQPLKLIWERQQSRDRCYDFFCRSKEESEYPAVGDACHWSAPGRLIWRLSFSFKDNNTMFNLVSVGFSKSHKLEESCFDCREKGICAPGSNSSASLTCDSSRRKAKKRRLLLIISVVSAVGGIAVAFAASLLASMWCRRKKTKSPSSSTLLPHSSGMETAPEIEKDPEAASVFHPTDIFRYQELHDATNGFSATNKLGEGGHGVVYRGTLPDGRAVAVKLLYQNNLKRSELFINEMTILSGLHHPNLVNLYGCTARHSRELLLVYEFVANGTVADHLHGHRAEEGNLTWPLRLRVAVEAATALAHLHAMEPPIIHRDVKTNNILLDGDFRVKIADFGLSRLFPLTASHISTMPQGTPGYVDPEYHRCFQLTDKSDVYSFGVVLAELISSKTAVDVKRSRHEINLSSMALIKIRNEALEELVDPKLGFMTDLKVRSSIQLVAELASRCLSGERDTRPTMKDVLEDLLGITGAFHGAEKTGLEEADHKVTDEASLLYAAAAESPDTVIGR